MFWKLVCFVFGQKEGTEYHGSSGKSLFQSLDLIKNKMMDNVQSIKINWFNFVKNIWISELVFPVFVECTLDIHNIRCYIYIFFFKREI
jgi:ribosomal protein S19